MWASPGDDPTVDGDARFGESGDTPSTPVGTLGGMWLHVLTFLAVARLARLVTSDRVMQPVRDLVAGITRDEHGNRVGEPRRPLADYFIECPWCTSVYLGIPVVTAVQLWPTSDVVVGVLLVLSASLIAGIIANVENVLDTASDALDTYTVTRGSPD